jgi:hypothetical protein
MTTESEIKYYKDRAERAEKFIREIRDSTFRSALTLRGMADRYLSIIWIKGE